MDRKAIAQETLDILRQGYYEVTEKISEAKDKSGLTEQGKNIRISIREELEYSVKESRLITPEEGKLLLRAYEPGPGRVSKEQGRGLTLEPSRGPEVRVENLSTVDAIRKLHGESRQHIGVLNFASAKNPGGGFINGAMAQEESLAASSTLYKTLTVHEEYYRENRAQKSMMYTDYGIYSPDVTFFRDGGFRLVENPVKASVLTLPAVNMGQVLIKGEDVREAKQVMRRRMKLALAIFADKGDRNLILGAYGCGVFRNDPVQVAAWWKEILEEEGFDRFESVFHAVLDHSKGQNCIRGFYQVFGRDGE